jgi:glycosyltransferase involved in cell wall biosynthesis
LWDVFQMQNLANQLYQIHSFKLVHCRSYISAIVGEKLKKEFGIKFLFDIRGFWADERVDGGIWNLKNPVFKLVYQYFKRKEKQFFENADGIVSLTAAAKIYIEKQFKLIGKVQVIPCAADLELFQPQSEEIKLEYRNKLGLSSEFVLLYLGSVGTWYLLDEMMDFFKQLQKQKPDAKFVFISGDNANEIQAKAILKGIKKEAILVQKADRLEVVKYIAVANAAVFFIKECFSKMASSPTKHGELLACEIPVVCNEIGDLKEIIAFQNAGILVQDFSDKSYQNAIAQLDNIIPKEVYHTTAEQFYALNKGQKKYTELYESLVRH